MTEAAHSSDFDAADLDLPLSCPACGPDAPLAASNSALRCATCGTWFPLLRDGESLLPWLFAEPDAACLEWSSRFKHFLSLNAARHNRLNKALTEGRPTPSARRRLQEELAARRRQREQIRDVLVPAGLDGEELVQAVTAVSNDSVPRNQSLLGYQQNVFRDWAWDNGENEAQANTVLEILTGSHAGTPRSMLTLGAGACRLPYDLHRHLSPRLSVALDFNPLLLLVGSRVIQGRELALHEFPVAPLGDAVSGILQCCRAPEPLSTGPGGEFRFVLGDATRSPFRSASFDVVVTPWLIDILPLDFRRFAPEVNRLLPTGGTWLNTGSLVFDHDDPCCCYSEAEVMDIVADSGFEILALDHRQLPYMQSPHSAFGRMEHVVTFAARKLRDCEVPTATSVLPDWLRNQDKAVPVTSTSVVASSTHLLAAQVLAAIDGKRSIASIAGLVAREYNLDLAEAMHAVRRILMDAHGVARSGEFYW